MSKAEDNPKLWKLNEEIRKLKHQNENLRKENRKLKSENKTLEAAWRKSEEFVRDVTVGRSVLEIIKDVNNGKLRKLENKCGKCKSNNISILRYANFRIIVCQDCKFKEKIDGENEPS